MGAYNQEEERELQSPPADDSVTYRIALYVMATKKIRGKGLDNLVINSKGDLEI